MELGVRKAEFGVVKAEGRKMEGRKIFLLGCWLGWSEGGFFDL